MHRQNTSRTKPRMFLCSLGSITEAIACTLICLGLACAEKLDFTGTIMFAANGNDSELQVWIRAESAIQRVEVKEDFSEDGFTVSYQLREIDGETYTSGVSPLCGADPDTQDGSVVALFLQLLLPDAPHCPIEKKMYKAKNSKQFSASLTTDVDLPDDQEIELSMVLIKDGVGHLLIQTFITKKQCSCTCA